MEDFLSIVKNSPEIFNNVFGVQVADAEISDIPFLTDSETIAASIALSGEYSGDLLCVLKNDEIGRFSAYILELFGLSGPVPDGVIFAEMINIYSGHLATRADRLGFKLNVGVPKLLPDDITRVNTPHTVRFLLDRGLTIKFYFNEAHL